MNTQTQRNGPTLNTHRHTHINVPPVLQPGPSVVQVNNENLTVFITTNKVSNEMCGFPPWMVDKCLE